MDNLQVLDENIYRIEDGKYDIGIDLLKFTLRSAVSTVPQGFFIHNVSCYYRDIGNDTLKSGIKCKILKIKDGRNFVIRHARATLGNQTILTCEISFHRAESVDPTVRHVRIDEDFPDNVSISEQNQIDAIEISGLRIKKFLPKMNYFDLVNKRNTLHGVFRHHHGLVKLSSLKRDKNEDIIDLITVPLYTRTDFNSGSSFDLTVFLHEYSFDSSNWQLFEQSIPSNSVADRVNVNARFWSAERRLLMTSRLEFELPRQIQAKL
ncbi:hypothetical protein WR25_10117 [Diploscapter pachys]|uniref:Uncharacterized protein n=1 Tax=Diploscapter pachys TaxID=2018661 RepID=A0A2A2LET3_9BILA|nr:hypothetical protein WR25_10117 [Diploscapter pachys]